MIKLLDKMKFFGIGMTLPLLLSCKLQTLNSNYFDEELYNSLKESEAASAGNLKFAAFYSVISNNCLDCHSHTHGFIGLSTETEWSDSGYVSKGSPDNSTIYFRMKSSSKSGDMPPSGSLTESEVLAVSTWISSLTTTTETTVTNPETDLEGQARTLVAQNTLSQCFGCHQTTKEIQSKFFLTPVTVPAFGSFFSNLKTADQLFLNSGLVTRGNPPNSWIYSVLKNHGSVGTMPPAPRTPLTDAEAQTIEEWITKMNP